MLVLIGFMMFLGLVCMLEEPLHRLIGDVDVDMCTAPPEKKRLAKKDY